MNPFKALGKALYVVVIALMFLFGAFLVAANVPASAGFASATQGVLLSMGMTLSVAVFSPGFVSLIVGIAFVLIGLIAFAASVAPEYSTDPYVTIDDTAGFIHVSVEAIRDYVKQIALSQNDIFEARAKVIYHRSVLRISLKISVTSQHNIAGVIEVLKADVRKALTTIVGLEDGHIAPIEALVETIDRKPSSGQTQVRAKQKMDAPQRGRA